MGEEPLEPVGKVVGAGSTDELGEVFDGVDGNGRPASIMPTIPLVTPEPLQLRGLM